MEANGAEVLPANRTSLCIPDHEAGLRGLRP
jgi:hypothetical protein